MANRLRVRPDTMDSICYHRSEWEIYKTDEVGAWFETLDEESQDLVAEAVAHLAAVGPTLGRPLVGKLTATSVHNLKELRPASSGSSEVRIIFAFDPWRSAILLVAGDKSRNWRGLVPRSHPTRRASVWFAPEGRKEEEESR